MAFGINREQLNMWKNSVRAGEIAFLTHYWQDQRFPQYYTVTKVGCARIDKLIAWGRKYDLNEKWIHEGNYPHFDLMGKKQYEVLEKEGLLHHIERFNLKSFSK